MTHPYKQMISLEQAVAEFGSVDPKLRELVKIRASQINGCAYCLKMHTDDARALGEDDARMHVVAGWREARIFTSSRSFGSTEPNSATDCSSEIICL
jgi:AhpD family alkylhydroperoxidase